LSRLGIFHQPLELQPVSLVAIIVFTHQPREIVVSELGLDQVQVP
jgi:hypothetical protein